MIVTTDSFGGVVGPGGQVSGWDTTTPFVGPAEAGDRLLLDGMTAGWSTDVLPPVAQPSTVRFRVYMPGPDALGTWLGLTIGDPLTVYAYAYRPSLDSDELFTFKGRVADVSAVNARGGGMIFSVVATDRLADLGSANAPATVDGRAGVAPGSYDLFLIYDQIAADAEIGFDYQAGQSVTFPYWEDMVGPIDLTNVTTLDALSTAIAHDVRVSADFSHTLTRYLTQQIDTGTTDPEAVARYRLNEWDPLAVNDLAGALAMHWDGAVWRVVTNTDYYLDGGTGMVIAASNVARDVGEWRQTRDQAINTVEGTSPLVFDDGTQTTRAQHTDLVAAYGRNTRSVPDWWLEKIDARAYLYEILLLRSQVQAEGFGFSSLLVAWETLTDDQIDQWASKLFPRFGVGPLAQPFTVVDIPDDWRLIQGPAVTGRLMGADITLAAGVVRLNLTSRTIPPSAADGITYDQVAGFGPAQVTYDNLDPTVSIDTFAIVGPSTV